jgi:hypothetical protein
MSKPVRRKPSKPSAKLMTAAAAPQPAIVPANPVAVAPQLGWGARVLKGLHADITRSGFVMTLLAIAALIISALSLQLAVKQQAAPPAVITIPYVVDRSSQSYVVKPVHQGRAPLIRPGSKVGSPSVRRRSSLPRGRSSAVFSRSTR